MVFGQIRLGQAVNYIRIWGLCSLKQKVFCLISLAHNFAEGAAVMWTGTCGEKRLCSPMEAAGHG